jgi:hypothetical protein
VRERLTGGSGLCYSVGFVVVKYFSNCFVLIPSKGCVPVHQSFQIKYARVDNLISNKLLHRSFPKIEIKFELKIREPN